MKILFLTVLLATAQLSCLEAKAQMGAALRWADLSDEQLAVFVKPCIEPLIERYLPLEIEFIKRVCGLVDEETFELDQDGREAINGIAKKLSQALRQQQPGKHVQKLVAINGQAVTVPTDFDQEIVTAPGRAMRKLLTQALKARWPSAWEQFNAEQDRLTALRKRARILIEVAALDECLLLSSRQRQELCELLGEPMADAWWRPVSAVRFAPEFQQLLNAIAGDSLGGFAIPEAWLAKVLRPAQLADFNELQRPQAIEVVIVQAAMERQPAVLVPGQLVAAAPQRRVVRTGPSQQHLQKQLTRHIERLIDNIDADCGLTPSQRDKLRLAGMLDIEHWRDQLPPVEQSAAGQEVIVQKKQVASPAPQPPVAIFSESESYWQKALQSRLSDEQKQKLAIAQRERLEFQRQALIEAVVAGYERSAALTSSQCEKLSAVLNVTLAEVDPDAAPDWRLVWLQRIVQLPAEAFDGVFFDFQRPATSQHQTALGNIPVDGPEHRQVPLKDWARPAVNFIVD
jgi:hypothetical protein